MQWTLSVILLSMLSAMVVWFTLDRSHWALILNNVRDSLEFRKIQVENQKLEETNQALKEEILMMEQTASFDRETIAVLQDEMRMIQDEIYMLKGELEFYQGVMDATRNIKGLNIQGVHIEQLPGPRNYSIRIVLTHVAKDVTVAEGKLSVVLEGLQEDQAKLYQLQDVALGEPPNLSYKFRNFMRFYCNFVLPEGFNPHRVSIQLQSKDNSQPQIKSTFDWPVIQSGELKNVGT